MVKGGVTSPPSESVIPEAVLDMVNTTLCSLEQLKAPVDAACVLDEGPRYPFSNVPPPACSGLLLARESHDNSIVRLKCAGVDLDKHPINSDLEALSLYETKLEKLLDLGEGPCQPSTALNQPAAARLIEDSLRDLTAEQGQSLREISKGERLRMNYTERAFQKRRKCQRSGPPSIQAAARDFLKKAAKEVMGENKSGFKGPLLDISDSDDSRQHGEDGEDVVIKGLVEISSDDN